jgi:hypothetical protein
VHVMGIKHESLVEDNNYLQYATQRCVLMREGYRLRIGEALAGWLAGWNGLRARRSDVRDAASLDTAERGRSSAGFMLMFVCVLARFLYGGTTTP